MAPTITRTPFVDDDLSGTTGTVINNAWKQELYDQIDAVVAAEDVAVTTVPHGGTGVATLAAHGVVVGNGASTVNVTGAGTAGQILTSNGASADPTFQAPAGAGVSTVTTTGNITALALPTGTGNLVIYMNNASLATIQGIAAGLTGQRLSIVSIGAGQVDLSHQDAAATAANRLINFATSGKTSLAAATGAAELEYDAANSRWRLVAHEQGAFITPTFAGGNFTANGAMTWTVDSGDVTTYAYLLRGRTLFVEFDIQTTTVGGTLNSLLNVAIPAGYTLAKQQFSAAVWASNNGTATTGLIGGPAASTVLGINKSDLTNWAAATNNTRVASSICVEVN
jgi:hypothetical protein